MGNCRSIDETSRPEPSRPTTAPPRAGSDVLCHICCNNGDEVVIPLETVTTKCSKFKQRTLCESCLSNHIKQMVMKQNYNNIQCLCNSDGCNVKYDYETIRKHTTKDVFQRYDVGLLHEALESNPEFCWCSNEGCGSGQLHGQRHNYPRMRCHACSTTTCFTHRCAWHVGRTCQEYEQDAARSDEVSLLQLLAKTDFRRCPNCNNGIEKNGGCPHMTCRCKHEFCWHCLAPYRGPSGIHTLGDRGHKRSCQRYSRS